MELPALEGSPTPGVLRVLPRGPHRLPREVVVKSQRARLLLAMAEVAAQKGYAAATVADVIARAGVSRATFYQQFHSKEDCFVVAYRAGGEAQLRRVLEAVASVADPVEAVRRNLRAYLRELVAFPAHARAFLVEVAAAGPRALAVREGLLARYVGLLGELYSRIRERDDRLPVLPVGVFRAAVAAVDDLVVRSVLDGRVAELDKLEPIAVYVELALFGLPGAAGPLPSAP